MGVRLCDVSSGRSACSMGVGVWYVWLCLSVYVRACVWSVVCSLNDIRETLGGHTCPSLWLVESRPGCVSS